MKRARKHAKIHGPGTVPEKELKHRVCLDMAKVNHFLEFANRPYFYQDVAYGSRVLTLDSGQAIPEFLQGGVLQSVESVNSI